MGGETHKPELPHNKNIYQKIVLIGLATIAEQAKSGFPLHTGALFLFYHNSAIKALFPQGISGRWQAISVIA